MEHEFELIRSGRKTVALEITRDGRLLVRAPQRMKYDDILAFVRSHGQWIESHLPKAQQNITQTADPSALRRRAAALIPERVRYWSGMMGLTPGDVKITGAKTRFGSCSARDSLCFSFYLAAYPMDAVDYVVVHELAHICYKNHGAEFYRLIARYLPDYRRREALLKQHPPEVLELYDCDRRPTGQTILRGQPAPAGLRHLEVNAILFDAHGRVLIQQRALDKANWPGLWDFSACGHVQAGETSRQALLREVREELGIELPIPEGAAPAMTMSGRDFFEDYYLLQMDLPLDRLTLQKEEVAQVRWATKEEVAALLTAGQFIAYHTSMIDFFFDFYKYKGVYQDD